MIKALLLIFEPVKTWDRIALAKRSLAFVLLVFFTPLVVLSTGAELAGIVRFGKNSQYGVVLKFSQDTLVRYAAAQLALSFAVAFICAKLIKSIAETFHSRNTYPQAFTVVAYALSPLFLVRLLDIMPGMHPWITFAIGIVLSAGTLYQGIPRMLLPDPPNAFGIFLMSTLLVVGVAGLGRLLSLLALFGKVSFF